jgi:hypothetical protein
MLDMPLNAEFSLAAISSAHGEIQLALGLKLEMHKTKFANAAKPIR